MRYSKTIVYTILSVIIATIAGLVLLTAAYSLPIDRIRNNSMKSFDHILTAPKYLQYGILDARPDYFTDFLMFNNASLKTLASPFESALLIQRFDEYDFIDLNLAASLYSDIVPREDSLNSYPRYWHGYLALLKPLLLFFDINGIRIGNYTLQTVLLLWVLFLLYKRLDITYSLAFLFAVLLINPLATGFCLQYSTVYYVLLVSMLMLLMNKSANNWKIFLWSGIATAYFDLLTYPIVVPGCMLIAALLLYEESFINNLKACFARGSSWLAGYVGMWSAKWILATIFTDNNVIKDAYNMFLYRTSGDGSEDGLQLEVTPMAAIKMNIAYVNNAWFWLHLAILTTVVVCVFKKRLNTKLNLLLLAAFAVLPFVWFGIVSNHSIVHPYITYRELAVSTFAIFSSLIYCFGSAEKKPL